MTATIFIPASQVINTNPFLRKGEGTTKCSMEVISGPEILFKEPLKTAPRDCPSLKLGLSNEFCSNEIYKAICERDAFKTMELIREGADVNAICQNTGNSFLHVIMVEASPIMETKYVPMVYQFSIAGVDLDRKNKDGNSPLHLSIRMHLLELMVALIKCGASCNQEEDDELILSCSGPVEYEFRSAYRKFAPGYWLPVEEDRAFKVNVLVKSWSRVNIHRNGKSLIEFAKEKGAQEKIIKMLMDNEVSIEFAHATIAGDAAKMQTLLQHYSVDMETKDYSHKENYFEPYCPLSLYGAAIKYGHKHVLHMLKHPNEVTFQSDPLETSENTSQELFVQTASSSVCIIL